MPYDPTIYRGCATYYVRGRPPYSRHLREALAAYEDALARTRFGRPRSVFCPGRPDLVQDADGVLANYFSTSFCAPHLFGERLADFEAEVRAELARSSPSGLFWDWPGDTQVLLATKPGRAS